MPPIVRFSDLFHLGATQGALDFVDIDVVGDVPVYLDPTAIRVQSGLWIEACQESVSTFFTELLEAIRAGNRPRISELIVPLVEPNETHLGVSQGVARGRSLGSHKKAEELIDALARSRAAHTGLLTDLEDTFLFVDGIGADILSDITTCVIRMQLIEYTQKMCVFWGVPMEEQDSGPMWDSSALEWREELLPLPRGPKGKLLLVPKSIVRIKPTFQGSEYYIHYLRPFFEDEELNKGLRSEFVKLVGKRKRARLKVVKGALDEHLGTDKPSLNENSERFPQAMESYRAAKAADANAPLSADALSIQTDTPRPNLRELYDEIMAIAPGRAGANSYHRAVAKLLTALFTGSLGNERIEADLHDRLKRVDILYDNVAGDGLFRWFSLNYHAALVVVECKNYEHDLANPELDQVAMRFSPDRGEIGFIVGRSFNNKERFLARCDSAARDGHGYVIVLDDADLLTLVEEAERSADDPAAPQRTFTLIRQRFNRLIGVL